MTLGDEEIARILKNNPDAPLEEVTAALIQAVEEARYPYQDNTTVLLYRPEADFGEGMLPSSLENHDQKQAYRDSGRRLRKCSQNLQVSNQI